MIIVFPGQGSQKIGMGRDVFENFTEAKEVFEEVDDAISFKLSDLIFEGTEEELKRTENTQPALMTVSMAFFRVMQKSFGFETNTNTKYFAGHSLGEYTALCADGVLSLRNTARILRARGTAMAEACPTGGAMAAVLGLDIGQVNSLVAEACAESEFVQVANDNSIGQVVISGHINAVKRAVDLAPKYNAKRALVLPVSGPFHSKLMWPAVDRLQEVLADIEFKEPIKPIIANVTAKEETSNFKELLLQQITSRVRWRESIFYAVEHGVSKCVEVGAGRVLTGLVKRISPEMELLNINSVESLEQIR